jgi:hypothetical protein
LSLDFRDHSQKTRTDASSSGEVRRACRLYSRRDFPSSGPVEWRPRGTRASEPRRASPSAWHVRAG